MALAVRLFGLSQTPRPVRVDTDDVYPVHMLDDNKVLRDIIVTWTLRFDDVLSPEKLHGSLSRLLEIGDWRKLGGRLRLKDDGKLEIHVPQQFTDDRPALAYSHQSHCMDLDNHPLAKSLPKATDSPSLFPGPEKFRMFAVAENAPKTLEDFIYQDRPQLALHIASFNDTTLVGLSWPHTLMDVMGQQALLRSWSLVLAGRESEVPPLLGAREDAVCTTIESTSTQKEELKIGLKQLKGWDMLVFGMRFAWDVIWNRVVETRTIFLPSKTVANLHQQAMQDLVASDSGTAEHFISEGDILTAWAVRVVSSSLPQPRPVTALHALNARFRLPSLVQAPGVYVQNMAVAAFALISPETARGPLGHVALENRSQLMEQATEGQVLANLRILREQYRSGNEQQMLCGESHALLMPFTNWTRASFFKAVDFSAAVVSMDSLGSPRHSTPGALVYHHASSMRTNPAMRNVVVVLGKDGDNNYWLTATLLPQMWSKMEEELKSM